MKTDKKAKEVKLRDAIPTSPLHFYLSGRGFKEAFDCTIQSRNGLFLEFLM